MIFSTDEAKQRILQMKQVHRQTKAEKKKRREVEEARIRLMESYIELVDAYTAYLKEDIRLFKEANPEVDAMD